MSFQHWPNFLRTERGNCWVVKALSFRLFLVCRRGLKRATEIINQDMDADQEHPHREDEENPVHKASAKKEK